MIKIQEKQAIEKLAQSGKEFISLLDVNNLSVEIYKPDLVDKQKPHDRDEFYVIISGSGIFELDGKTTPFQKGDFLFVPAFVEHRFIEFSDDFTTWVFFIK
ncbi:cupin domain-containing protein [Olivibacter sp. XZL3]|uniref:cupin domain-containing protein n=1 Tax=Olivibacter sp. XZL3 TaxID=1735116 RepID=UPI00106520BA|nr:cupin domain-containing protein [Olivibacter sp. XZL3]